MRKCKYRNCQKIINGRPNKLYCNRKCKSNESKYIFRKRLKNKEKLKIKSKKYREDNKEYYSEYNKEYYSENKEDLKDKSKIYREDNKEYYSEYNKEYLVNNKEKINQYKVKYKLSNPDKVKKSQKEYSDKNKEKIKIRYNQYRRNRRENDPLYKLIDNIRCIIKSSYINKNYTKQSKTFEILGCSYKEFSKYIESQFEYWMTWENHGLYTGIYNDTWQYDHIIPVSTGTSIDEITKYNKIKPLYKFSTFL